MQFMVMWHIDHKHCLVWLRVEPYQSSLNHYQDLFGPLLYWVISSSKRSMLFFRHIIFVVTDHATENLRVISCDMEPAAHQTWF